MYCLIILFVESGLIYFQDVPQLLSFELSPVVGNIQLSH